ncbi:HDIG domain-containing metalloprotein [Desulfurobacterium sp. TC5-1]|uniref:HD family phosphohydrolase n=1 Tax=Desulfurobacterium sp. TC5-1 TaxID=1158318 RepID=UPI0003B5BC6C|nr:HDIG domain-containing metalloprotein [Desulfurobacterium sp. TC5-1]
MKSKDLKSYITEVIERVSLPILAVACSLFITFLMLPIGFSHIPELKVGNISPVDIRSPANLIIEDKEATKLKIEKALQSLKPVFQVNPQIFTDIQNTVEKHFSANGTKEEIKPGFIADLLERYYSAGVVDDKTASDFNGKAVEVKNPLTSTVTVKEVSTFYTVSKVKKRIKSELLNFYGRKKGLEIFKFIEPLIKPNIYYSREETLKEQKEVKEKIKPVLYEIKKGELIVKKGTKLTKEDIQKINAIKNLRGRSKTINKYVSIFLISLLMFYLTYKLYFLVSPSAAKVTKNITFSFLIITLDVFLIRIFTFFAKLVVEAMNLPLKEDLIFIPVITSTVFISMFLTKKVAAIHAIPVSILPSFLLSKPSFFIIPTIIGSVFSCFDSRTYKDRNVIYKSSLFAGVGIAVSEILLLLYYNGFHFKEEFIFYPMFAIIGSGIASIIVIGLLPLFGSLFKFTTDMVYMELINLNHPLLRKLVLKAPGTYSHSVMVSTLAEAAAETIGANSLLAKAGGLFHDIGKLKNPQAFVENQQNGINMHDTIPPEKSAAILRSHVEYGVELGRKHELPEPIIDIIRQHHGTKLMKYFYAKAKEQNPDVDEKQFRYPGPKPQFKEAGIVMLADTVEAAVKSVKDKKDVDIDSLIHKLIMEDIEDGQLNQCGLSLKEINLIEKVFKKILSGVYHNRVEYPEDVKQEEDSKG